MHVCMYVGHGMSWYVMVFMHVCMYGMVRRWVSTYVYVSVYLVHVLTVKLYICMFACIHFW